eukprot:TRINITY_DN17416_c0_g2_i1.p1 TRINITY_DN17416_c0_g2~~TRINITY_DN17416_c0_g2_i1.p1  ORF type:complete len:644 (+),score=129.35 TRINITY_DN17416_c0_g2_i1:79-2010(+)
MKRAIYVLLVPLVGFIIIFIMTQTTKVHPDPIEIPAEDLIRVLKMKKLTDTQKKTLLDLGEMQAKVIESEKKEKEPETEEEKEKEQKKAKVKGYPVAIRFSEGSTVRWNENTMKTVESGKWGGGVVGHACKAVLWGKEEQKLHCYREVDPCREFSNVTSLVKQNLIVGKDNLGKGPCQDNTQVLEVTFIASEPPPAYSIETECNENAVAVLPLTTSDGYKPNCVCKPQFIGEKCQQCREGFENYPWCHVVPYKMDLIKRTPQNNDHNCPSGLVQYNCNILKHPRALLQPMFTQGYAGILGCAISKLPWGCELGSQTTPIKSLCTLVTGEFVGAHLMLLFESIRVFAAEVPFVVGVDQYSAPKLVPLLKAAMEGRGVNVSFIPLHKTPGVPFWFHEKPNLMKQVLKDYENTLWLDADTFLVSRLKEMPNTPAASFGCAVHDPRGWGSGYIPQMYGYSNSGVVYARRGSPHLDAWIASMQRFEHMQTSRAVWQGMESMYLDQGPIDVNLASTRGGFRLEPQWNVGWWTPDKRLEKVGRPNWWIAGGFTEERVSLSAAKDAILLDDSPIMVVHSHYIKAEKAYGELDLHFNTLIYNYVRDAAPGTLLAKFAPRLSRYATHVTNPDPTVVRPKKGTMEFLDTLKNWD